MNKKIKVAKRKEYVGHKGSLYSICLSVDHCHLFSTGDDGVVAKWDLLAGQNDGEGFLKAGSGFYAMKLIPERNLLVAGGSAGSVFFADIKTREIVYIAKEIAYPVYDFLFIKEKNSVAVLYGNGWWVEIDLETFGLLTKKQISYHNLRTVIPGLNENECFVGSSDHHVHVIDKTSAQTVSKWKAHDNSLFALALHPVNKYLISGGRDAMVRIWDLKDGPKLIKSIPAHNFTVNDIKISQNGDYFASASRDKSIKIWDAYSFNLLKVINFEKFEGHQHSVNKLCWWNDDNSIISCSDDRKIMMWDLEFVSPLV